MINLSRSFLIVLGIVVLVVFIVLVVIALDVLTKPPPNPEISQFRPIPLGPSGEEDADSYRVYKNMDITFEWQTQHAATVTFGVKDATPEAVSPNGHKHVWTITQDNSYVLEAVNATDSVSETIQLQVIPVHFVKPSATGSGDCSNWTNACALSTALEWAEAGDEIWVEKGVHKPGTERTDTFQLSNDVALYGGFLGIETSRDQRDWKHNITVLSGDIGTPGYGGDNSYHVVYADEVDITTILDGFTISDGQSQENSEQGRGGGMHNNDSSPTLANLTFSGNWGYFGGGMYNQNSSPSLTNVTFSDNQSVSGAGMWNQDNSNPALVNVTFVNNGAGDGNGGGMYNYTSSPILTSTEFISNSAFFGGGMYNENNSGPTLTNVTFSGNHAGEAGGGMHNEIYSSPALSATVFISNSAELRGGGMHNGNNSNPQLTDVTFSGNKTDKEGGGMSNYTSSPTLENVIFRGNSVPTTSSPEGRGGGMYNNSSSPILTSTEFISNRAYFGGGMFNDNNSGPTLLNVIFRSGFAQSNGGGIYNWTSSPTLVNVTFANNTAVDQADTGAMRNHSNSSPTLTNCILWDNSIKDGQSLLNRDGSTSTISHSLVQGSGGSQGWDSRLGSDGGGNIDNSEGIPIFKGANNLDLQEGSPAIDVGDNAAVADVPTDLDGNPRICNDTVDMGAYEFQTEGCSQP